MTHVSVTVMEQGKFAEGARVSEEPTPQTSSMLPIYQGLLDEVDEGTRATVIGQQGEGLREQPEETDGARTKATS